MPGVAGCPDSSSVQMASASNQFSSSSSQSSAPNSASSGGDRTVEVKTAQELLQTMGFRTFVPLVAACPGCGRTTSSVFQELARARGVHLVDLGTDIVDGLRFLRESTLASAMTLSSGRPDTSFIAKNGSLTEYSVLLRQKSAGVWS